MFRTMLGIYTALVFVESIKNHPGSKKLNTLADLWKSARSF